MTYQSALASTFDSDTIISITNFGISINEGFGHETGYDDYETAADIKLNDDFYIESPASAVKTEPDRLEAFESDSLDLSGFDDALEGLSAKLAGADFSDIIIGLEQVASTSYLVEPLNSEGCDVNISNARCQTPLILSVMPAHRGNAMGTLTKPGANINAADFKINSAHIDRNMKQCLYLYH